MPATHAHRIDRVARCTDLGGGFAPGLTDADERHGGCGDKLLNLRDSRAVLRHTPGRERAAAYFMHEEHLDVESLHLWRGDRHVLRGVGFSLSRGECLQVTGPNGSGKTSLLAHGLRADVPGGGAGAVGGPGCAQRSAYLSLRARLPRARTAAEGRPQRAREPALLDRCQTSPQCRGARGCVGARGRELLVRAPGAHALGRAATARGPRRSCSVDGAAVAAG